MENANIDAISFKCTVCGKCCNSAPLMSLPELFHHEKLFVGCLSLRRIRRHKIGETLFAQGTRHMVSTADEQLLADMAEAQLFNDGGVNYKPDYDFAIMTQAMDYESLNKCPALGEDYHCLIQENRKPAVCSMVPFDALYPDSLQNIVLLSRDFEENCIINGFQDDYPIVVRDGRVACPDYRQSLQQRRDDLRMEKQSWGETVFAMLRKEGFCNPAESTKIPMDNGLISLSIFPALMAIAQVSNKCHDRCLQYIDNQIELIDSKISQAISRKSTLDKQTTKQFRSFKEYYFKFSPRLAAEQARTNFSKNEFERERWINAVENYLGIS